MLFSPHVFVSLIFCVVFLWAVIYSQPINVPDKRVDLRDIVIRVFYVSFVFVIFYTLIYLLLIS